MERNLRKLVANCDRVAAPVDRLLRHPAIEPARLFEKW